MNKNVSFQIISYIIFFYVYRDEVAIEINPKWTYPIHGLLSFPTSKPGNCFHIHSFNESMNFYSFWWILGVSATVWIIICKTTLVHALDLFQTAWWILLSLLWKIKLIFFSVHQFVDESEVCCSQFCNIIYNIIVCVESIVECQIESLVLSSTVLSNCLMSIQLSWWCLSEDVKNFQKLLQLEDLVMHVVMVA